MAPVGFIWDLKDLSQLPPLSTAEKQKKKNNLTKGPAGCWETHSWLLFHEDLSVFMYKTIIELHFAESYLKRGIRATQTFHCTIITTDKGIWPKFRADTLGSKSFRDSSILGQSPIKVTYCKGS